MKDMTIDIDKLDEKGRLEAYAIKYFIAEFNRCHVRQLKFSEFAKPPNPDAYCFLEENKIGLEVTHLYGIGARVILGRERPEEENLVHTLTNEDITEELNFRLKEKAQKKYSNINTWLLIRNVLPGWGKKDFESWKSHIELPTIHSFKEIWLLCDRNGSSGILQLYP
ncbi:MAG: hypothetical protein HY753_07995 [Nitrospirae bacterium]|nr:hypothetical protein [Nitrospirota bacterium]